MRKTLKLTYSLITLALVLTTFGCNNDDEATIPELIPVVTEETICSNDSYTWVVNSITYEGSDGTQSIFIDGTNGIADQTLNLTVSSQPTEVVTDVTICSDETYTWTVNATTYDGSAGTQTVTIESENCAADQTLNITVTTKPMVIVTDVTICSDETYTWAVDSITYEGAVGSQTILVVGENCEADQTLNIMVTPKPTAVVTDVTLSSDDTYNWAVNATSYDTSTGSQTVFVEGENCEADQTLNITVITAIGDFVYGGIVFWVDPADNTKGLVCALNDQDVVTWGCDTIDITGANATEIGAGATNTMAILASCSTVGTAADIASNLNLNGYDDWFLPSKDELNEIYVNRNVIDATAAVNGGSNLGAVNTSFWSSTQFSAPTHIAFFQGFSNGSQNGTSKTGALNFRAVRAY